VGVVVVVVETTFADGDDCRVGGQFGEAVRSLGCVVGMHPDRGEDRLGMTRGRGDDLAGPLVVGADVDEADDPGLGRPGDDLVPGRCPGGR
jgi:hypothetical protein